MISVSDILSTCSEDEPVVPGTQRADEPASHYDLYDPIALDGFVQQLLGSNMRKGKYKTMLDWCLDMTDICDERSREFLHKHSLTIAKCHNKRQLVGFLKTHLCKKSKNRPVGEPSRVLWFLTGFLVAVLTVLTSSYLGLSRGPDILEQFALDRKYLGYFRSLRSILDAVKDEVGGTNRE